VGAHWNFDAVGSAFAEAAVDPSRWVGAMDVAASATGSTGAVLLPIRGRLPNAPFSESIGPLVEAYFREGWVHRDERVRGLPVMLQRGAFADLDFTNTDEIARDAYYQEFLRPHGLRWFGGVRIALAEDLWVLAIQRTITQGPFSPDEVERLAALSKSLAAAGALARALGFARIEAALAAFEVSGLAVALFDRLGKVLRLNAAAEALLGTDLMIAHGRIASADHDATAALNRALHALLWAASGQALAPPVALPRADKRPLLAYAVRPPAICGDALAACQAVVVFIDPDARPQPPETHLKTAFGLSPAEARLAARLATGEGLADAANRLGVTYETARTELKRVFLKLGVSRQSELVLLLANLTPVRAAGAGDRRLPEAAGEGGAAGAGALSR
jgi:DNA-binding CsgD family transcriptional regulator/PAS domain-containing protein